MLTVLHPVGNKPLLGNIPIENPKINNVTIQLFNTFPPPYSPKPITEYVHMSLINETGHKY